jgi:hypothetical protein
VRISGFFGRVNEFKNEYKHRSEVVEDGPKLSTVDAKQGASEAIIEMD